MHPDKNWRFLPDLAEEATAVRSLELQEAGGQIRQQVEGAIAAPVLRLIRIGACRTQSNGRLTCSMSSVTKIDQLQFTFENKGSCDFECSKCRHPKINQDRLVEILSHHVEEKYIISDRNWRRYCNQAKPISINIFRIILIAAHSRRFINTHLLMVASCLTHSQMIVNESLKRTLKSDAKRATPRNPNELLEIFLKGIEKTKQSHENLLKIDLKNHITHNLLSLPKETIEDLKEIYEILYSDERL